MGFLNTNSMPRLVEKLSDGSNIKISGNSNGSRVSTVVNKIVEKADDVTKAIEQEVVNESYSFKVGTGDVDVSSSVVDGFGEVGIKGVTYQNLLGKYFIGSGSNDYISIESEKIKFNKPQTGSNISIRYPDALVQPSKTYTLMFYVYKNTLQREDDSLVNVAKFNIVSYNTGLCHIPKNTTGLIKAVLHQPSTVTGDGKPYLEVYGSCFGELEISYPVLLEGDHTNNPNLPSYFEGIVGVGDKSKNLFNPKDLVVGALNFAVGSNINQIVNHITTRLRSDVSKPIEIKPNTQYSIKLNQNFSIGFQEYDSNKIALRDSYWRTGEVKITTTSNSKYVYFVIKRNGTESPIEIKELDNGVLQIEEGDTLSEYQPYGTHKIEILSYGKNLFDGEWKDGIGIHTSSGLEYENPNQTVVKNYIRVKPNTKYFVGNGTFTIWVKGYGKIINKKDAKVIKTYFNNGNTYFETDNNTYFVRVEVALVNKDKVVIISEGEQSQLYEPYQEDKTQILLDEPLMRLPNGVCDEITRDGKLIRRVGKVVLDGSEAGWKSYADKEGCWMFAVDNYPSNLKHRLYENTNLICDITPIGNLNIEKKQRSIFVYGHTANNELRYAIPKTILAGNATHLFKQWLQANPTTIYYELAEPIVTELPAPYLRIFKDGHLTFNTLVAPESTHVVQLNKSAQIERSIREVQGLDGRVEKLESFYDDMILETSHKLNLLNFDFDYMRNTEDEI